MRALLRAVPLFVLTLAVTQACSSKPPPTTRHAASALNPACGPDQIREYYCDELLPTNSSMPAPAPYEACPGSISSHQGTIQPTPPTATFDGSYTAYIRKRMPPGNSCCYSWCNAIKVVEAEQVPADRGCGQALAMQEQYCFESMEGGTSRGMASPYEGCPVAIQPPAGASFSVPPAAGFDQASTQAKRAQGFQQCCYAWCSKGAPTAVPDKH